MENNNIKNLIKQYLTNSNKLKKFDRIIFKRLAPNVLEVSDEFRNLALKFEQCGLFQYSGMCFLGAAKCQKSLANDGNEIDFYLKSARSFKKQIDNSTVLLLKSDQNDECFEGAIKSYNSALDKLHEKSVMKAAIIREIKSLCSSFEDLSNFSSPCHRFYDLEASVSECIKAGHFLLALEKLTDIFDNINERRKEFLYEELLSRVEISRILLIIILNLPSARNSPSNIKIIEKYSSTNLDSNELKVPSKVDKLLRNLICSWIEENTSNITITLNDLSNCTWITVDHRILINFLIENKIFDNVNLKN